MTEFETPLPELKSLHWDVAKLLNLGVSAEFASELSPIQTRDLLKGILYCLERKKDLDSEFEKQYYDKY